MNREQQVAALIVTGASNGDIAQEMRIAVRTVKVHVARLHLRHGVKHRGQLIHCLLPNFKAAAGWDGLAPKERRIARLAVEGLTNAEIAIAVSSSISMVKNYMKSICDKMGVWSRYELAAKCLQAREDARGLDN